MEENKKRGCWSLRGSSLTWRDLVIANLSPFVPYYGMQTEVEDFDLLAGGDIVENPVGYANLPTKIYSAKASEFLTWIMKTESVPSCECWHPPQPPLDSYAWALPLTHLTFELQLPWPWACVPITVSYRTETGHTLKEDLILTRRASNSNGPACLSKERVMKTWKRNERFWRNMKRLLGQYSDRQNKMQCK